MFPYNTSLLRDISAVKDKQRVAFPLPLFALPVTSLAYSLTTHSMCTPFMCVCVCVCMWVCGYPSACSVVTQEQTAHFEGNFSLLHHAVASMYERVQLRSPKSEDGEAVLLVHDQVSMRYSKEKSQVVLSWESTPVNDMVADSLVSLILQTQSNPAAIRGMSIVGVGGRVLGCAFAWVVCSSV
jgi:Pre-mRNA 3'-end-processing endonuclease polyadenylation factor C-term